MGRHELSFYASYLNQDFVIAPLLLLWVALWSFAAILWHLISWYSFTQLCMHILCMECDANGTLAFSLLKVNSLLPWATMCTVIVCFLIRQVVKCLITVWNSRNCSYGKSTCLNVVWRRITSVSKVQVIIKGIKVKTHTKTYHILTMSKKWKNSQTIWNQSMWEAMVQVDFTDQDVGQHH